MVRLFYIKLWGLNCMYDEIEKYLLSIENNIKYKIEFFMGYFKSYNM